MSSTDTTLYRFRQPVVVSAGFYQGLSGILVSFRPSRGAEGNMYLVSLETGGEITHLTSSGQFLTQAGTKKVWIPGRHLTAAPAAADTNTRAEEV